MNYRIDDLQLNNLKIMQNPEYFCFGVDSVLLSDFAKNVKDKSTILEIGTGNGIIPLLLSTKTKCNKIYGIEIQKELYKLAIQNIELNNLQNLITLINDDIKNISSHFSKNSMDAIITNPPYKKSGTGIINENEYVKIAKHEIACSLDDIIKNSNYLLKDLGKFFMVHRPDRLIDICCTMRKYHIEPKKIRFVHSKPGEPPVLILVEGIKYGKPFLKVEKPLYIYNKNSKYTDEIYKIYGKESKNE